MFPIWTGLTTTRSCRSTIVSEAVSFCALTFANNGCSQSLSQKCTVDSAHMGSNRFATILLYMTDLEEGDGGETVFAHGWPANQAEEDRVQFHDAKMALRESGEVEGLLAHDSWEENMVVKCRHRLAVRPHSSRAVLFYSQNPDGTPDSQSLHGGCPVIKGEKWAASEYR